MFSIKAQISSFIKIRPVGAYLCHADRRTDGQMDVSKLTVAFRNTSNAPKNDEPTKSRLAELSGLSIYLFLHHKPSNMIEVAVKRIRTLRRSMFYLLYNPLYQ
jgi:hypothetical protein